jgi:hypothetical protein
MVSEAVVRVPLLAGQPLFTGTWPSKMEILKKDENL